MQEINATFAPSAIQLPKFLAAKPALPGESLASWIQRLTGDHQYSFPRLIQILDFEPTLRDWDLPLPSPVWERLQGMVQLGKSLRHESLHTLASVFPHIHPGQLRWYEGQYPCTAWCTQCLTTDKTPYLRWEWRLHASNTCFAHREPLSTQCPVCAAPFLLHTSRLVAFGVHGCATTLAECARCGMLLKALTHEHRKPQKEQDATLKSVLNAIQTIQGFSDRYTAQRALKYFCPRLPNHRCAVRPSSLRLLQKAQPTQRYPRNVTEDDVNTAESMRQRQGYERAWLRSQQSLDRLRVGNADNAQAGASLVHPVKMHWSWKLGPTRRIEAAKALHLVRGEKRAMRAQIGITPSKMNT